MWKVLLHIGRGCGALALLSILLASLTDCRQPTEAEELTIRISSLLPDDLVPGDTTYVYWETQDQGDQYDFMLYSGGAELCRIGSISGRSRTFEWVVDDCGSGSRTDYRLQVRKVGDDGFYGFSNYFPITVSSGCEFDISLVTRKTEFPLESPLKIKWQTGGTVSHRYCLELFKSGQLVCTLQNSIPEIRDLVWTVTDCGMGRGSDYRLRISDGDRPECGALSKAFEIVAPRHCSLYVEIPRDGDTWYRQTEQSIEWYQQFTDDSVILELWRGSGCVHTIDSAAPATGTYWWAVNDSAHGVFPDYRIRIADRVDSSCWAFSAPFLIASCEIGVVRPLPNDRWGLGDVRWIQWQSLCDSRGVRISLQAVGQAEQVIVDSAANTGQYLWDISGQSLSPGEGYRVVVRDIQYNKVVGISGGFALELAGDRVPAWEDPSLLPSLPDSFLMNSPVGRSQE